MKKWYILIACILAIVLAVFFVLQVNSFSLMQWAEGLEKVKIVDAFHDLDTDHRICIAYNKKGQPVMFQTGKNALGFWCIERMGADIDPSQANYHNFIWFTDKDSGELGSMAHEAIYGYGDAPNVTCPQSVKVEQLAFGELYVICLTASNPDVLGQVSIEP